MTQMTQMTAFSEKTSAEKKLGDVDIFFLFQKGFEILLICVICVIQII